MSRMNDPASGQGQEQSGSQMGEAAASAQQQLRDVGTQVRDAATEKYNELRDQAQQYYEQGRARAEEWEQSLESYVHEKPIQSLLIAAGVGMLLGILWKR